MCSERSINVPGSTVVMLLPTVVMGMIMMVILHLPGTTQTLCKLVIVEVGLLNDGNPRVIESF